MISVIIPTYNRARCIGRAIESVLKQTITDIELIVVDDGSTDNTESVVREYKDPRLVYIKQEHRGACATRNHGIEKANGEWIAFQDSDDWWFENKLEMQFKALIESKADIVFCAFERGDEGSIKLERFPEVSRPSGFIHVSDLVSGNLCSTQTILFSKGCFQEDKFNEALPRLQDWELMLRMTKKWKVYYQNEVLVKQYIQKDSISTKSEDYFEALQQVLFLLSAMYKEKEHYCKGMNEEIQALQNKKEEQQKRIEELSQQIANYQNSDIWKITAPYRFVMDRFKATMIGRGLLYAKQRGMKAAFVKTKRILLDSRKCRVKQTYTISETERKQQRETEFAKKITISILVPLYNTPEKYLREMIESVRAQTYSNWELCLADGSDAEHKDVGRIVGSYSTDKRIKYQKLQKNMGISENTNACIDMATGQYIALFDHDDLLHPSALYEVMKAICEKDADFIYTDENTFRNTPADAYCPHFKSDFAPDTLRSYNYVCHFTVFKASLLEETGRFRGQFDGSQDYDMVLRLTEKAERIVHIPKILYYWRSHSNSVASGIGAKPYTLDAARRALAEHLQRIGLEGEVTDSRIPSTYHIQYRIKNRGMVSILIPNKDHVDDLRKCLDSIRQRTTYSEWEAIIIENNSTDRQTFEYYQEIQKDSRIHVVEWKGEFNYSAINNFGAQYARGEYILLLNNDVEVITSDWLEQMIMFAQRDDAGAVGCMLYYPDDTVQHAGVVLGIGGVAGHAHKYFKRGDYGYMSRMSIAQNYSAVTAACLMMRKCVWDEVGGLDEGFQIAFNDVDLCMRIREAGYLIIWTPYAELYHYESKSRGLEDTPEKQKRFVGEIKRFRQRWSRQLEAGDPYYNPNLTLDREDFSIK